MTHHNLFKLTFLFVLLTLFDQAVYSQEKAKPNVLFIAIDDLRPELACYGASHIYSPNMDALAGSGRRFDHAYCQQSVCNPSRSSLMTGMRPDSIGVTGNHMHFRSNHPEIITLPEYFKQHGYVATAIGKIYHGVFPEGTSNTRWDTMGDPQSWSTPVIRFGPRYYYTEEGMASAKKVFRRIYNPQNPAPDDWTKKLVFGPATESPDITDPALYDGKVADAAVQTLREWKKGDKPFFLAAGFIKPHSPYVAPKRYFDLYEEIDLASHKAFPADTPAFAGHGSSELRRYTDQPKRGEIPIENQRRLRHAYFACVSYIDAQVGRLLSELDRSGLSENTIVVLYGDHGYHLGEHGLWGKTTNFELDTRVPLIVRVPGMKAAGTSSPSLVELVDLYPTLVELAGLPLPNQLEGKSFTSILDDPSHITKSEAFSQYPRKEDLMGYSMRTPSHRLTHWVHQPSGVIQATELYDYTNGLVEKQNIASTSPHRVKQLSGRLKAYMGRNEQTPSEGMLSESDQVLSFEQARPGPFDKLETPLGTWTTETGRSMVDDKHAKTGNRCLQLTGGTHTSVTLHLADGMDLPGKLTFWTERWTRRAPFSFRIEEHSSEGWEEIFNGDDHVRVGRAFLSHVAVSLGNEKIRQLRFSVTSPPDTGILIDDVRITPARPQKIKRVQAVPLTLPALVGVDASPLLKLKIETEGNLNPVSLTELRATLNGDSTDVESVLVFFGGPHSQFTASTSFGKAMNDINSSDAALIFSGNQTLLAGTNYLWIACKLSKDADIDHEVGARVTQIRTSHGPVTMEAYPSSKQRLGVALRQGGDEGVHTYRIPGLATTNDGTLIGVYDVRRQNGGDLPGNIDVGMSRSTDAGRTWEPMRVIMDMGNDPDWRYDGIGDPAVLVDRQTGSIWVAATWSHGNRSWIGSMPGLEPEETGQLMLVHSDDDGVTWSEPINITQQVKRPEWSFILQGPGKGITMRDGTLVFAAQYQDPPDTSDNTAHRLPHSTIIYSNNHGKTWQAGTGAFDDTTEAQVVEIEPGLLMLNCRYNRGSVRVVMTTRDMGATWQKHATSERSLIEPRACMASLINVERELGRKMNDRLLFSNPDSIKGRNRITIKASLDRGLTWPKAFRLLLDEGNGSGYSCMTMIDEHTVGILYEGSQAHMTFQRVPLTDIIGKPETNTGDEPREEARALKLPQIFSDHMVLQANVVIPVWGKSHANSTVQVSLGKEKINTTADASGNWSVQFEKRKATASPTVMRIESEGQQIQFKDIVVGEVWVCAGQSNMEWALQQSARGHEELSRGNAPQLRLMHLRGGTRGTLGAYDQTQWTRLTPETYCKGKWKVATTASASEFSAVGWYFGRFLQQELQVPVGLICPAVGGTPTEAWIPAETLLNNVDLKGLVSGDWLDNERLGAFCRSRGRQNLLAAIQAGESIPGDACGPNHPFKPGFMWQAGIKPLIPFAIRGVIWYQGESNAETPARTQEHGKLFPLLIHQWRSKWGQGDFPFLYVQLPALNRPEWPRFRDGQRRTLDQLTNLGMAITLDTGHQSDVHPLFKKPVGERLAIWALGTTYGSEMHTTYSGPLFDSSKRKASKMVVSFKHAGDGLTSSDGMALRHFEVCGKEGVFHMANVKVIDTHSLLVWSPKVPEPQEVRYAWHPFPKPPVNLVNSAGLPASPFSSESEEKLSARYADSNTPHHPMGGDGH
ncbi:sulfatase-like hydrolase/transferase [Verrucomicrobia bacterium]|nr:sulfatase-like hydrolase/transferase [Verrucomicrobiota bacterium]